MYQKSIVTVCECDIPDEEYCKKWDYPKGCYYKRKKQLRAEDILHLKEEARKV